MTCTWLAHSGNNLEGKLGKAFSPQGEKSKVTGEDFFLSLDFMTLLSYVLM